MDLFEVERHKIIVDLSANLSKLVDNDNKAIIEEICSKSKQKVGDFNKENRTVVDITNRENGRWHGSIKTIINKKYLHPITSRIEYQYIKHDYEFVCKSERVYYDDGDWYLDEKKICKKCKSEVDRIEKIISDLISLNNNIIKEFRSAVSKTNFSSDLKEKYILLSRRTKWYDRGPLEIAVYETLRLEILATFLEQNRELINKYN